MGLDVTIYFQVRDESLPVKLEGQLPQGFVVQKIPKEDRWNFCGATHELDTGYRYYSPGYARGPWQLISGALMVLFATPDVIKIWHGHDCSSPDEITIEDVLATSAHYMKSGRRSYFNPT